MKNMRNVLLILGVVFFVSCSNGLNKSIIETLTVDELKANIKKDTTFTAFYKDVQELRAWVLESDVNQAKWGSVTYKDLIDYRNKINDTIYIKDLTKKLEEEYKQLYPDYTGQVDSIMNYWRKYKEDNRLENYVTIEFDDLWKEYYSYSSDVKDVNVGFKITPLKGKIQQLVFRYDIKSKISNTKEIGFLDGQRCLASSPISSPETLYWEAGYSQEKILKNRTTSEIKRDYDFLIEIVEVRINGVNLSEKDKLIPENVNRALKYCSDGYNYYADDIIKELINSEYKPFYEYSMPRYEESHRTLNPEVYDLIKSFSNAH